MSQKKKIITGIIKYTLALSALGFVLSNADLSEVMQYFHQISWWYFIPAFVAINITQYFSALRLQHYADQAGLHVPTRTVVMLHYVGLFFNFILPGGIGGDAYKGYILKRGNSIRLKRVLQLLVSDRASGLYMLCLMLLLSAIFIDWRVDVSFAVLSVFALIVVLTAAYFFLVRLLLAENTKITLEAMPYSFGVQAFSILSFTILWQSLGNHDYLVGYIILFQLAAIVGVLPISVGGLGLREMTFFYGATYIARFSDHALTPEFGIALSLCFYGLMVTSSLLGLLFLGKMGGLKIHHKELENGSIDNTGC